MPDPFGHVTPGSIFDDLGRSAEEAASLKVRAALMQRAVALLRARGVREADAAAALLGMSNEQAEELLAGRLSRFTSDALVSVLAHAGVEVHVAFSEAA